MMKRSCYHCKQPAGKGQRELRPYGPGGVWVCFGCAFSSPERMAQTEEQMGRALDAIDGPVLLTNDGFKKAPGGGVA